MINDQSLIIFDQFLKFESVQLTSIVLQNIFSFLFLVSCLFSFQKPHFHFNHSWWSSSSTTNPCKLVAISIAPKRTTAIVSLSLALMLLPIPGFGRPNYWSWSWASCKVYWLVRTPRFELQKITHRILFHHFMIMWYADSK